MQFGMHKEMITYVQSFPHLLAQKNIFIGFRTLEGHLEHFEGLGLYSRGVHLNSEHVSHSLNLPRACAGHLLALVALPVVTIAPEEPSAEQRWGIACVLTSLWWKRSAELLLRSKAVHCLCV